jgi:putative FmdB family regulatory protein
MPIYEFECEECGSRFEELLAAGASDPPCASCGAVRVKRLISNVAPPGRQPRGAKVRSDESRRREREAGHQERLARDKAKRARGEQP